MAGVADLWQPIQQAAPLGGRQGAAHPRGHFKGRERWGEGRLGQRGGALRIQGAHPELLGPVVTFVEVLRLATETGRRPQELPAAGLVGGTESDLAIHETLDRDNRMAVDRQPIGRKPGTAQTQRPAREIGELLALGQDQAAAVLGQELPAGGALGGRPTQPGIAGLEMKGWSAPAQQNQPLALVLGDVTELLADELRVLEVMALGDQRIPAVGFGGGDEPDPQSVEHGLFGDIGQTQGLGHAEICTTEGRLCPLVRPFS